MDASKQKVEVWQPTNKDHNTLMIAFDKCFMKLTIEMKLKVGNIPPFLTINIRFRLIMCKIYLGVVSKQHLLPHNVGVFGH